MKWLTSSRGLSPGYRLEYRHCRTSPANRTWCTSVLVSENTALIIALDKVVLVQDTDTTTPYTDHC